MRRTDDDRVAGDHGCGVQADLTGDRIDLLVHVLHQIDDAVGAEIGNTPAGGGVEHDEAVSGCHVDDLPRPTVVAIRQPATGELSRRRRTTLTFIETMHPQVFAGSSIHRDHGAPRAGRRVDHPIHHQGGRLEVVLRPGTEVVGLQTPLPARGR